VNLSTKGAHTPREEEITCEALKYIAIDVLVMDEVKRGQVDPLLNELICDCQDNLTNWHSWRDGLQEEKVRSRKDKCKERQTFLVLAACTTGALCEGLGLLW
jgi:hypothetical protein